MFSGLEDETSDRQPTSITTASDKSLVAYFAAPTSRPLHLSGILPSPMNPLLDRAIARQEAALGAPLDYLRTIGESSNAAVLKMAAFQPLASHRSATPPDVWHLARLAATRVQDCGTCVQVIVNQALGDGVPAPLLRAALADGSGLEDGQKLALRFGHAVASGLNARDAVAEVRDWFGAEIQMELALGVATCQVFPILKRGLGQDLACSLVTIEV